MPQVVQGPVGAQRVGGAVEHRPRGVVGQRPKQSPPSPQRIVAPGRQRLVALALVQATLADLRRANVDLPAYRRLVTTADAERERIERDLHDGAQQ